MFEIHELEIDIGLRILILFFFIYPL